MVLQHAILVERKETIDITVQGNKFYLQENSDEYGGHDLNIFSFFHIYITGDYVQVICSVM